MQSSKVIPAFFAYLSMSIVLQYASRAFMLAKERAVSKIAQFLSILPAEKLPPTAIVWTPPPKPTTQGLVGGGATASAVATGIFDASTVVLLSYVEVFPLLLFVAAEVPP